MMIYIAGPATSKERLTDMQGLLPVMSYESENYY